jgi:hypothetical protein
MNPRTCRGVLTRWQLNFDQKYKLYNPKAKVFLRAHVVEVRDFRYVLVGQGTEEQATYFHFTSSQGKSGQIERGDSGLIYVHAADGRDMGALAYPPMDYPQTLTAGQTSEVTHKLWRGVTFEMD